MTTPDLMPILSRGAHNGPEQGACLMEYASFLAGEPWTDHPSCTHPALATMARAVNDRLGHTERQALLPLLPRLMSTGYTADDRVLSVRLAVWCARQVAHRVPEQHRAACTAAVDAAEAWADNPNPETRTAAAHAAAHAAACAINAAACAAHAAYAAACAAYAAYAVYSFAADAAHVDDLVRLLADLLDEYDRLTGRTTPTPISTDDLRRCVELTAGAK